MYSKALVHANKPALVASPLSNLWKILSSTSGGNSIWVIFQIYIYSVSLTRKKKTFVSIIYNLKVGIQSINIIYYENHGIKA